MVVRKTETPEVTITNTAISPPLGYFALVKRGDSYCAVKFTEKGRDADRDYRYAVYEWHYQDDGSSDFMRATAKHGTGKATYHYVPIIGRIAFQTGNQDVACGQMHIKWYGDTTLTFEDARNDETEDETIKAGVRIAPTKWTSLADVNALNKSLSWYAYDGQRKVTKVLVEKLW